MHPDPDPGFALFSLPGWRREKLQVLRWLAHDRHPASPPVLGAVERALGDADWELRVTAMLAAARLHATQLAATAARLPLPDSQQQGLAPDELRLLHALRDAALAELGAGTGRALPPGVAEAVRGDVSALRPGLAACVHALSHPLPADLPAAPAASGVVHGDTGPELADGTLLAWVPPVPHWLGDEFLRHALANPPRRHVPTTGFFIDAAQRGAGTRAQALDAAQREAQRLGRPVALPQREQWEMAARGPDGRRFPWGMNAEAQAWSDLSPWGMSDIARGDGEWLQGDGVVAGGRRNPAPARHEPAAADAVRGYRFVYA